MQTGGRWESGWEVGVDQCRVTKCKLSLNPHFSYYSSTVLKCVQSLDPGVYKLMFFLLWWIVSEFYIGEFSLMLLEPSDDL